MKLGNVDTGVNGDKSLPSRERGLKSGINIEIQMKIGVAPFAGAWIEIYESIHIRLKIVSLPSRERGLKYL